MLNSTSNIKNNIHQIEDERRAQGKRYKLDIIIWMMILGVLQGQENIKTISTTFSDRADLRKLLGELADCKITKIPHPTTISRALNKMNIQNWKTSFCLDNSYQVGTSIIKADGKFMNGIHDGSPRNILSLINEQGQPIYQTEIIDKENEITGLMKILKDRSIPLASESIFTADAIFTQTNIIKELQKRKIDYILKVKDNQSELKSHLEYIFSQGEKDSFPLKTSKYCKTEYTHDRETTWKITSSQDFNALDLPVGFESASIIGRIKTNTISPKYQRWTGKKYYQESNNEVFFISSLVNESPDELFRIIRNHWSIESMHWLKDTLYQEDKQTLKGQAAYIFTFIKTIALGLIKQVSMKISETTEHCRNNISFFRRSLKKLNIIDY